MYTQEMLESIKKLEASREARMANEPRRMTADEKTALLEAFHPDYNLDSFDEIKVGPNKGQKAPVELTDLLADKFSKEVKADIMILVTCLAACDETISREETAFLRQILA